MFRAMTVELRRLAALAFAGATLAGALALAAAPSAEAAGPEVELPEHEFSFEGLFGTFDRGQVTAAEVATDPGQLECLVAGQALLDHAQ